MGLCDVSLCFEHSHVVTDRGAGHTEVVPVDESLGADRLLGGHVIRHDGAQDLESPLLGTRQPATSVSAACRTAPLGAVPCQSNRATTSKVSGTCATPPRTGGDAVGASPVMCPHDLQGRPGRQTVSRSRTVSARLVEDSAPPGAPRRDRHDDEGARTRPAVVGGLDLLRRSVPTRRPVAGRAVPRGRAPPCRAVRAAEPAGAARACLRVRRADSRWRARPGAEVRGPSPA